MARGLQPAVPDVPAATAGHVATVRTHGPGAPILLAGMAVMAASIAFSTSVTTVAMFVAITALLAVSHRTLLRWPVIVGLLVSVMLFVPVGRYSIPVELPFELELYRLTVLIVLVLWFCSLLVDTRVGIRRTPLDRPVAVIVCATLGSIALNPGRVAPLGGAVLKSLTFFLSFVLLYYFIVSVVRERRTIERLTKLFVAGTAVTAAFTIFEQRTGFNIFDHVRSVLPFLRFEGEIEVERYGVVRAVGASSHPIELGVLFALALPLALAFAFVSSRRWWIGVFVVAIGMMSSVSRTPLLAIGASILVLLWLRPLDVKRLLPLVIPLIVVVKIALPGSLATVKQSFFPESGLIAEHAALAAGADPLLAGGRIRQLGPSVGQAMRTPAFGQGLATRQTGFDNPLRNAPILDNQWLGTLLELGLIGIAGWAALLLGAIGRLGRAAQQRAGPDGWLHAGFAASIAGFGVAMFTFDAFAFTQVTFVLWLMVGLAASLLLSAPKEAH